MTSKEDVVVQRVSLEIQPGFADDGKLSLAWAQAKNHESPDRAINAILKAWCKIAKLALSTATYMARAPKMNDVSKIVEVDAAFYDSYGVQVLEEVGLISVTDKSAMSDETIGEDQFTLWWNLYPYRTVNGKLVKNGKRNTRNFFFSQIVFPKDFDLLLKATENYKSTVGDFARDPERFLKAGFWRDYIALDTAPKTPQHSPGTKVASPTVGGSALLDMMKQATEK